MKNFTELEKESREIFISMVKEELEHNYLPTETIKDRSELTDLHHKLFNEDYFIIGYYEAEKFLEENGGVFNAIGVIKEYEKDNFGEVTTDFSSSEKVVNMFAYIIGEELIYSLDDSTPVAEVLEGLEDL